MNIIEKEKQALELCSLMNHAEWYVLQYDDGLDCPVFVSSGENFDDAVELAVLVLPFFHEGARGYEVQEDIKVLSKGLYRDQKI